MSSWLRVKQAYIQQLESGRIRLAQLEQEMQMARTHQVKCGEELVTN